MKKIYILVLLSLSAFISGFSQTSRTTAAFTPGNVVVCRIGDGTTVFSNNAFPVFLDEYNPALPPGSNLVQTIALPTSVSGANKMLTSAAATFEAWLTLSADGQFLVLLGYNAAPGTVNVNVTPSATTERVIGLVDYNGNINTTTGLTDLNSGGPALRSATSTDGVNLWAVSTSGAPGTSGLRYTTVGSSTSIEIQSSTGIRGLNITAGQLYATAVGAPVRYGTVGTGTPTTTGQPHTPLPGTPTTGAQQPYQITFADLNPSVAGVDVFYVADDGANALRKYSFDGTVWTLNGTLGVSLDDYRGLTSTVSGTTVTLYATRKRLATGGGELVSIVDISGWNGAFGSQTVNVLATASANTAYAGVALAPSASCAAPSISIQPSSSSICSGNTAILSVTASGSATLNYQWYQGTAPDQTNPVGTNSNSFTTPALTSATNYWVKVTNGCGTINSTTATVGIYTSAIWTGSVNNDFNLAGNWNTNCVPGADMDIIIPSGTPTLTGGSASVRNVTLQAGATLNLDNGGALHVKGDFINDGNVVSGGSPADGKIVLDGTVTQNMSGAGVFSYVEINNSIDVFVLSSMSVRSINALPGSKFTVNPSVVLTVLQ